MTFVCLTAAANLAAVSPTVCTFFRFRQPGKPTTFLLSSPWPCLRAYTCVCVCMQNTSIFCAVIPTGIINYPSRAAPKRHRLFVSLRVPQNVATVSAATLTSQCRLIWQSTPRKLNREWGREGVEGRTQVRLLLTAGWEFSGKENKKPTVIGWF